ncbi:iron chelate uptake ABC transporter family permease subunit [Bengtsoniella intestinalis]|uniref:ABC transporter permease n=1 Tax=Bengtsoniella intestinalis TaxID=3073143 RepID=UPI00391F939E
MALALAVLSVLSLFIGAIDLTPIFRGDTQYLFLLFISRVPRLLAILCTGVGMSVAGLIMQQLCMNKFVSPTTGATISSAQFGIMLSLVFFTGTSLFQRTALAFACAMIGTWIYVWMIQRIKVKDMVMVPLIGIMFGSVISGFTSYFALEAGVTQSLSGYLVGSFALIIQGRYEIVFLVLPLILLAYIFANHFNIVGMGENFANNLGVNYNVVLFLGLSIAALITASIVVVVGSISYIGLIVPNAVAMFRGDKIRNSLLDVSIFGALFVLICDVIGRLVIHPYELPIDLISGILGSAIFLVLMFKRLAPPKAKKAEVAK